jgi:cellulase (glycosyl hydrolase family 5)
MRAAIAVAVLATAPGCHERPDATTPAPADGSISLPPDAPAPPPDFAHVSGDQLVDGDGQPLLLRAMGIGNWLVPEGYMWRFDGARGDRPRRIEARVAELIGPDGAAAFWEAYRDTFFSEADVARIADLGFNAIRVALSARLLQPEGEEGIDERGFAQLAQVVEWSRAHGIHVVFDMHAAPGGQTGRNIDDSPDDQPALFTDPANQDRLVALWTEIARRFAGDPVVLGYDLLNEPIAPEFAALNDRLWPLYQRIGAAIRAVDPDHVLIVEGAQWANNWSSLGAPFDDNLIYSFHKYWDDTSAASIQGYLDHGAQWGKPLWVGEIGENDDDWYRAVFPMLEAHGIGWSFWTWKKLDSDNNPYAIPLPDGWERIQAYVDDPADRPTEAEAQAALDELVARAALDQSRFVEHAVCAVVACP